MKKILLLLSFIGILSANEGTTAKVVFDLTTGKIKTLEKHIIKGLVYNKTQYENVLRELDVAVVIHGKAYKFFVKDLQKTPYYTDEELIKNKAELQKRLASMHETYNVEFLICANGLRKFKIDKSNLLDFVKTVPTSTMGLIDKQNQGYAYLPVGD